MSDCEMAILYVYANVAVIGNAARLNNEYALAVQAAFARYCQHQNDVTAEALVKSVAGWKQYRSLNPQADL